MSRSESTRPSRTRANAWLVLVLPVAIALAACEGSEGPMGPEGPPGESGPGTRLVLSGVFGDNGVASQILPPEAGTLADPPAASCWISPDSQFWFTNGCLLVF